MPPVYAGPSSNNRDTSGPRQKLVLAFIANWLAAFCQSLQRVLHHHSIFIFNTGPLKLTVAAGAGNNLCHRKPS